MSSPINSNKQKSILEDSNEDELKSNNKKPNHFRKRSFTASNDDLIAELSKLQLTKFKRDNDQQDSLVTNHVPNFPEHALSPRNEKTRKPKQRKNELEVRTNSLVNCKVHYQALIDEYTSKHLPTIAEKNDESTTEKVSNQSNETTSTPDKITAKPIKPQAPKQIPKIYTSFKAIFVLGALPVYHPEADDHLLIMEKYNDDRLILLLAKLMKNSLLIPKISPRINETKDKIKKEYPDQSECLIKEAGIILEPIITAFQTLQRHLYILFKKIPKEKKNLLNKIPKEESPENPEVTSEQLSPENEKQILNSTDETTDSSDSSQEIPNPNTVFLKKVPRLAVDMFECLGDLIKTKPLQNSVMNLDMTINVNEFLEKMKQYKSEKPIVWEKIVILCFGNYAAFKKIRLALENINTNK